MVTDARFVISRAALDDVDAHAREEYPNESCGLVFGPAGDPWRLDAVLRLPNEADRYHRVDPERYPRTAREYFTFNVVKARRAVRERAANAETVRVIYHSHCDVGAYFSPTDAAFATALRGTEDFPEVYLVTSVRAGAVDDHKVFVHRDGAWVEAPLTVA